MNPSFKLAAISRKDGSQADGIHLLWSSPYPCGYSVNGYDVERRPSVDDLTADHCYELTAEELQTLNREMRVETPPDAPMESVSVRPTQCPKAPPILPDQPYRSGLDFTTLTPGSGANPRNDQSVTFEVLGSEDNLLAASQIKTSGGFTGLDCGHRLNIALPFPTTRVELTLVHNAKPPKVRAFSPDGERIDKIVTEAARGVAETLNITGDAISRLDIIAPRNETLLLKLSFDDATSNSVPNMQQLQAGDADCFAYDIALREQYDLVNVTIDVETDLAIASSEGKAVDKKRTTITGGTFGGTHSVSFKNRKVDRVLLYVNKAVTKLKVCVEPLNVPLQLSEQDWQFIATGIQLPIRAVNPSLVTTDDETALAGQRLLSGESLDGNIFAEVSEVMNGASADSGHASPMWFTMFARDEASEQFIEMMPWPFALTLLSDAAWRRMLGFGYFDNGSGLEAEKSYDYRVTGYFRRRDIQEEFFGFHTIPEGTLLPLHFYLGTLLLLTFKHSRVETFPQVPDQALRAFGRKGISLTQSGFGLPSLAIIFDRPVNRIALELEPDANHSLSYEARPTDFFLGISPASFSGAVPRQNRVEIVFPEFIDTLFLRGQAFLYSVRIPTSPEGSDPEELVHVSTIYRGAVYTSTPAPPPPVFLGTTNLQQPAITGDPAITVQNPPPSLGFHLFWVPPLASTSGGPFGAATGDQMIWPPDLDASPPMDVLSFQLERKRVDDGGDFAEVDGQTPPTMFYGSRTSDEQPQQIYPGSDLLSLFPEQQKVRPPVSIFMQVDDVLVKLMEAEPQPGSFYQYRIFSVDPIGRRSLTATLGSRVRLEKHLPPPPPVGSQLPAPGETVAPRGVRARIIQKSDMNLDPKDLARLAGRDNAVVVEWGWTKQERDHDPFAKEFRIYFQPTPPDTIRGSLIGTATLAGGFYQMNATLDQSVAADSLAGKFIVSGDYAFKIDSHTEGKSISIRFAPSKLDADIAPIEDSFEAHRTVTGGDLRPSSWPERVTTMPITAEENYEFILPQQLEINAANPIARSWVGVTAADDQVYVPDELSTGTNSGRAGNESSIAVAVAQARYVGRPAFTPPVPLPDVPEVMTQEPTIPAVTFALNLNTFLPTLTIPGGHKVQVDQLAIESLIALIGMDGDNITLTLPDGTIRIFDQLSTTDLAEFLNQIRSGDPGLISNRYLMAVVLRQQSDLDSLWQAALSQPVQFGAVVVTLPSKAERYLFRIRLVDAADHVSNEAAILPLVVRVPSLRSPSPPRIKIDNSHDDSIHIEASVHDSFDLEWLLLFTRVSELADQGEIATAEKAQLLRLPNRRDLFPNDGIRLRLRGGELLAPAVLEVRGPSVTLDPPDRVLTKDLTAGFNKRVAVWAAALTRDGIPSRFAGPQIVFTGPQPLVVPTITISKETGFDEAAWTPLDPPAEISIERSLDGGTSWSRVSPWLPETLSKYRLQIAPSLSAIPRQYRLALRGSGGRLATGPSVSV